MSSAALMQQRANEFRQAYAKVQQEIGKVIVGHTDIVHGVLTCLFVGGHALLEGVPGLGKTLLVRTLSQVLDIAFNRIQFTPDLMPSDIIGTNIITETHDNKRVFSFQPGPIFAQIVLADEINRATPKTQSALLEAMQEHSVTVGGTIHKLKEPFFVMATQNPIEQEGTYPLPEAQLDRFFFKLHLNYSTREEMATIALRLNPAGAGAADKSGVVRAALNEIAKNHATPAEYFSKAETDLAEVRSFTREKALVPLPARDNLKVIETPVFMRGIYSVGGFNPAPALQPKLGAFYWLTPIEPTMSADRVESKLREYNTYGLKLLTIHEAIPGHYLQFEFANDVQPNYRRVLRAQFGNSPYVEGWAVYATELVVDAGYMDHDPRMKLTWLKQYLRAVANTILDVKMQTGGMTDEQAMDLMVNQTFQENEEATGKLRRAKLSSAQLPTYFTGFRAWKRLRQAAQARGGASFQPLDFHAKALKAGAVPMPALERILATN